MDAFNSGKEIELSSSLISFLTFQSLYGNVFTDLKKKKRRDADDILVDFGDLKKVINYILSVNE